LWTHASTHLSYVERQHPFSTATLSDQDLSIDFAHCTIEDDRVAVIVTTPLTTNEPWTPLPPHTLACFVEGQRWR
jgi:glutamine amidotransferase